MVDEYEAEAEAAEAVESPQAKPHIEVFVNTISRRLISRLLISGKKCLFLISR